MKTSLPWTTWLSGSLLFLGATISVNFFSYLLNLLVVRSVSLADYGEYAAAFAYLAVLTVPLQAMGMIIIKKVGSVPRARQAQVAQTLKYRFENWWRSQWWLAFLVLAVVENLLLIFTNLSLASTFFIVGLLLITTFLNFYLAVIQGLKKLALGGVITLGLSLAKLIAATLAIWMTGGSWQVLGWLYGLLLVAQLGIWGWSWWVCRSDTKTTNLNNAPPFRLSYSLWQQQYWLPLLASTGLMSLLSFDVMIVKQNLSLEVVGWYAALALMAKTILYLTTPISSLAYTFLSDHDWKARYGKLLFVTCWLIFMAGGFITIAFWQSPQFFISLLFDSRYLVLAPYLWMAGAVGTMFSLANTLTQFFVAQNSRWALLTPALAVLQMGLLIWQHQTFTTILLVNILTLGILIGSQTLGLISSKLSKSAVVTN